MKYNTGAGSPKYPFQVSSGWKRMGCVTAFSLKVDDDHTLSNKSDSFRWTLFASGVLSVKSVYVDLINSGPVLRPMHRASSLWSTILGPVPQNIHFT